MLTIFKTIENLSEQIRKVIDTENIREKIEGDGVKGKLELEGYVIYFLIQKKR